MKASASSLAPSKTSPAGRERARTLGAARSHAARATSASDCPAHARTRSAASAWPARLCDVAPDVALEVRQAPLPGAARQDPGDGGDEPRVGVGHREPHAAQAPVPEGAEELGPGGLALAVEAGAAEELLVPGGRHADRRDERDA